MTKESRHARSCGGGALGLLASAIVACGGEAPRSISLPVSLPSRSATSVPPHDDTAILARVDAGDGRTLYVGKDGRRELLDGAHTASPAPAVVLDDLVGVLRDNAGGFVFVTRNGATWRSAEPLGVMSPVGPGAFARTDATFRSQTTGARAIVGTTKDGRLLRSTDDGLSFVPVHYAGSASPYGRAAFVALDPHGNGILVHLPQRLFVTHDDGATWAPLPSVPSGAHCAERDGSDQVYLCQAHGPGAVLDGDTLRPVDRFVPLYTRPKTPPGSRERQEAERVLVGDHVVELAAHAGQGSGAPVGVSVRSARGLEPFSAPAPRPILVGASGLSKHVGSYGPDLVYLRDDLVKQGEAATSTLLRSSDDGATWRVEGTLDGTPAPYFAVGRSKVDVAIGPKGWAYVASLRLASGESVHQKMRPAGASAFEDLEFTEPFEPTDFVFDETGGHVFALGMQSGIFESPLDQNRFTRVKALDLATYAKAGALTMDAAGVLHAFFFERSWSVRRMDARGAVLPTLYLPFDGNTAFAFAGARGLAIEPLDRARPAGSTAPLTAVAWETADAGETWSRVAPLARFADFARCTEAGCLEGVRLRAGWDLPTVPGTEQVAAAPSPLERAAAQATSATASGDGPEIVCRPSAPAAAIPLLTDSSGALKLLDAWSSGARWAMLNGEPAQEVSLVLGTRTHVHELPLLSTRADARKGSPDDVRGGSDVRRNGIVAARYTTHDHWAEKNPLDIELAWWSATTGRTGRGFLHNVPPFHVNGGFLAGYASLVDGGLIFQPPASPWTDGRAVKSAYFLGDDGRVQPLSLPDDVAVVDAARAGSRLLLERAGNPCDVELAWSDNGGKSWKTSTWTLVDDGGRPNASRATLSVLSGRVSVGISRPGEASLAFALTPEIPDGPPEPRLIDETTVSATCGADVGTVRYDIPLRSEERLRVRIETPGGVPGLLVASGRAAHATEAGTMCSSAYELHAMGANAAGEGVLYPEGKSWSGWWFVTQPDPKEKSRWTRKATPLSCDAAKVR